MSHANADPGSGARLLSRYVKKLRFQNRRRGAVLAVVALSMVGLLAVAALALDIGMMFSARGEAQRTADAAALAGASAFLDIDPTTHPTEARAEALVRAYDYATRQSVLGNPVVTAEVTPWVIVDSQKVRVRIRRDSVPTIFARILGINFSKAWGIAAAEAVHAGTTTCLKPFAIPDMWNLIDPTQDLYKYDEDDAPIWDFDVHLRDNPPAAVTNSGHCVQRGSNWDCPPERWDVAPAAGSYSNADPPTGYGTEFRNQAENVDGRAYTKDEGRRIPLKISPHEGHPSFWFPWRMPGNAGANDYINAIKGCVNGDFSIGDDTELNEDIQTENGNMPMPTFNAITDLIDNGYGGMPGDPLARWDENTGTVVNSAYANNPMASPRVITVAVFNPENLSTGQASMEFVDFATFFLEDPRVVYPDVNPQHMAPITGRLIKFTSGSAGPVQGNLTKRLRLVE
jgi:hypothetical protein